MLKKLTIRNFQSHKKSVLEFSPGVNVIIGKTDSGKSAVIRSLRLITSNQPSGGDYVSHWAKRTHVSLQVDDIKDKIEYIRDASSRYIMGEEVFTGIGTTVPSAVQKALNIQEVNLQPQLEKHFLLMSTPGEVATYFNKVARLDMIDRAESGIKKSINSLKRDIEVDTAGIKETNEKIQSLNYLYKAEIEVEVLEQLHSKLEKKQKRFSSLTQLVSSLELIEQELSMKDELHLLDKQVSQLLVLSDKLTALENISSSLIPLIKRHKQNTKTLKKLAEFVSAKNKVKKLLGLCAEWEEKQITLFRLKTAIWKFSKYKQKEKTYRELTDKQGKVDSLLIMVNALDHKQSYASKLQTLLESVKTITNEMKSKSTTLDILKQKYQDSFPDSCPLCGADEEHYHL